MKSKILILCCLLWGGVGCKAPISSERGQQPAPPQPIVTQDLVNFWAAYDAVRRTTDTVQQKADLQALFIDRASVGQQRMMAARNYSVDDYLTSIRTFPQFWNSLRPRTESLATCNKVLRTGVDQLRAVYPSLETATIYYTVGTHRSPGTGVDSLVLIGTEFALADDQTVAVELPEHLQNYYKINPSEHLSFLVVHEYVHTQQQEMVYNLLSLTLYEGIADFVAAIATGDQSPFAAYSYGPAHEEEIKQRFEQDLFRPNLIYDWLWNAPDNEFNTSDLGYYVGYRIAASYYTQAADKQAAIRTLIQLDFQDQPAVERIVDGTGYLSQPLEALYQAYEASRPTVIGLKPFANGNQAVDPTVDQLTVVFSEPMDEASRNFDFGPLGEDAVVRFQRLVGYTEDSRSLTFDIAPLLPNKQYQLTIGSGFRNQAGVPLKPYLIDFKTKKENTP
ncbi:MAG: hypothetical protein DA408_17240 [Bacteroidetes bacterium]|nr:MAG: hypothetical protein DA408_17240 [Bacteroidota bacterium]